MKIIAYGLVLIGALSLTGPVSSQQSATGTRDIHLIWMGGNDCPPCRVWRALELPKLKESSEFQQIKYSYVTKAIGSSVPSNMFLPAEVRPYKDLLDTASGGIPGSPQAAVIVDGQVYDYFRGVRSAEEIESMLKAIRTGGNYPFNRCVRMSAQTRSCELRGS